MAIVTFFGGGLTLMLPLIVAELIFHLKTQGMRYACGGTYGTMFAGCIIASVPMLIVILFAMRAFMRGLAAGAIKS